jgi:hypothetical protein
LEVRVERQLAKSRKGGLSADIGQQLAGEAACLQVAFMEKPQGHRLRRGAIFRERLHDLRGQGSREGRGNTRRGGAPWQGRSGGSWHAPYAGNPGSQGRRSHLHASNCGGAGEDVGGGSLGRTATRRSSAPFWGAVAWKAIIFTPGFGESHSLRGVARSSVVQTRPSAAGPSIRRCSFSPSWFNTMDRPPAASGTARVMRPQRTSAPGRRPRSSS